MEYTVKGGVVTVSDLTVEQMVKLLMAIALLDHPGNNVSGVKPSYHNGRKHRPHLFGKRCPQCGKKFKGAVGLATHQRKAHSEEPVAT